MSEKKEHGEIVELLLYRPRRIATITDQSISKVYKDMNLGLLETVRLGRSVRVPADSLRRYVQGVETRAADPQRSKYRPRDRASKAS